MKQVNLIQGTPEWHAFRAEKFTASDASAMLGFSKYKTRDQLLNEKHAGNIPEVSAQQQYLFDKGHRTEAQARAILERELGEDLYPVTGVSDEWERMAASLDGITMCGSILFEHKLLNESLVAYIADRNDLPDTHWPQVEHQLYVSSASECIFIVSDGTEENRVKMTYKSDANRRETVINGWKQFEKDLAAYVPPAVTIDAVAEEVTDLPAIFMTASGSVSVVDNFEIFEKGLTHFLNEKLIREPKDDNDFATLDLQIKTMKKAEDALEAAGDSVLAQVEAVDRAMKKKESLRELVRDNRLMAEKLLKAEKERRRLEIVSDATQKYAQAIKDLSDKVGIIIPSPSINLNEAMKGKKTISSLQSAANDEVARASIEAQKIADIAAANLKAIDEICDAETKAILFPDLNSLVVSRITDDFVQIANARVIQHKAALEKAANDAAEAARKQAEEAERKKTEESVKVEAVPEQIEEAKPALADIPVKPASELFKPAQTINSKLEAFCDSWGIPPHAAAELIDMVNTHFAKS